MLKFIASPLSSTAVRVIVWQCPGLPGPFDYQLWAERRFAATIAAEIIHPVILHQVVVPLEVKFTLAPLARVWVWLKEP
jgi:hypothetical protein